MIEEMIITTVQDIGFPIFVAIVLLYDKIKTNGNLRRVVENNSLILKSIEKHLKEC